MNPIALALDVNSLDEARALLEEVSPYIGVVKIGLEMFTAFGPEAFKVTNLPIFLDLKLHDIPTTVERAVGAAIDHGVNYLTIHCQQDKDSLQKAVRRAYKSNTTLVGVTVLTSTTDYDLKRLKIDSMTSTYTGHLTHQGVECGLNAFVCSAWDVFNIRHIHAPNSFIVVPGIRINNDHDDQKRYGTPEKAIRNGANLLVIGRPIRDAKDRAKAAQEILARTSR